MLQGSFITSNGMAYIVCSWFGCTLFGEIGVSNPGNGSNPTFSRASFTDMIPALTVAMSGYES
jgi:hypothetical protein